MAIEYVGGAVNSRVGATSGSVSIDLTADLSGGIGGSLAEGDVVVAVSAIGTTANVTLSITDGSTDYTIIGSQQYVVGATYDTVLRVAYKRMGATPDTTVVFGPSGGTARAQTVAVYVLRGVDPDNLLDVAEVTSSDTASSQPNPGSITPSTPGAFIIAIGAAAMKTSATFSSSDLTGFLSIQQNDNQDSVLGIGYHEWTSGAFDAAAWTGNSTTNASWATKVLAFLPASGALTLSVPVTTYSVTLPAPTLAAPGGAAEVTANVLTSSGYTTDGTSMVTASITVTAGRPVLIAVGVDYDGGFTSPVEALSVSGAGQTWAEVGKSSIPASIEYDVMHLWKSDASSGGSGAITVTFPEDISTAAYAIIELEPSAGATAAIGSVDISADGGTASSVSDSISSVGSSDYQITFASVVSYGSNPPTNFVPRSGWTEIVEVVQAEADWSSNVHLQISPQGGDTTASASFDGSIGASRLMTVPITVTGGSTPSLDVPATSYVITLPTPSLLKTSLLSVPATAYSVTAPAPTLNAIFVLDIPATEYAVSLPSPALLKTSVLDVPAASYAVTLPAPALQRTLLLSLGVTEYTVTLPAPELTASYNLEVPLTAYTVSLPAPSLLYNSVMAAPVTEYTVTLTAPNLVQTFLLSVPVTNYIVTEPTPTLALTILLEVPVTEYIETVLAPALLQTHIMAAPLTEYIVTLPAPDLSNNLILAIPLTAYTTTAPAPSLPQTSVLDVPVTDYSAELPAPSLLSQVILSVPATAYSVTLPEPVLTTDLTLQIPLTEYAVSLLTPLFDRFLDIPLTEYTVTVPVPTLSSTQLLEVSLTEYDVTAPAPSLIRDLILSVPATDYAVTPLAPSFARTLTIPLTQYTVTATEPELLVSYEMAVAFAIYSVTLPVPSLIFNSLSQPQGSLTQIGAESSKTSVTDALGPTSTTTITGRTQA